MPEPPKHDDSGGFLSSSLARAADHFAARDSRSGDDEPGDRVEIWARRLGRALSAIAFVALVWYFGHQLRWW
ncbi:MAG: hypothetical protein LDL22_01360 [Hyphomicrobiales bacterium]|jgi:hypothetical protein|uniref:hypothetical protein n=1 Tax=Rhabdaerophilum calidifontis TaxID=2604328 RepID=UPI00123AB364|nr:hypothetical protein [Rhabdaerophilum calidifontis]MCA1951660.1 hypothetical protein [Hyphomicrobiales bacterium]